MVAEAAKGSGRGDKSTATREAGTPRTSKSSASLFKPPLSESQDTIMFLTSKMAGKKVCSRRKNSPSSAGKGAPPVSSFRRYPKSYPLWNDTHFTLSVRTRPGSQGEKKPNPRQGGENLQWRGWLDRARGAQ